MASVRSLKKDIDYLFHEVLSDSYLAIYFHPEQKDRIIQLMEETVAARNSFIVRASNPKEKTNRRLVKKYYKQLRTEVLSSVDTFFDTISQLSKR